jgi:hypothetical protein
MNTTNARNAQDALDATRYGAVLSSVPPAGFRTGDEEDVFTDEAAARDWARTHIAAAVAEFGSGWDFRVDIGRITAADAEADTWNVVDDHTARAEWDSQARTVVWPSGPHTFENYA